MNGSLCAPCRIDEHGFCTGDYGLYVGGEPVPTLRGRCGCTCCPQEPRGICDRFGCACSPETASQHRTCRPRHYGGHPMSCARCQQPIESGQQYDRLTPDGGSVGKPDILRHLACPGRRTS
ncbi:hypothetical protein [Streptomyces sp. SID8014]|nr:hypothetical protein [Streptomyces sp. SID8014]